MDTCFTRIFKNYYNDPEKICVIYTLTPHTSPILYPLSQSFVMVFTSSHDCHPASALSFSTICLQVVFGLSLLPLFPSGAQVIATLLLLFWSCLCPFVFHLFCFTPLLIGFMSVFQGPLGLTTTQPV